MGAGDAEPAQQRTAPALTLVALTAQVSLWSMASQSFNPVQGEALAATGIFNPDQLRHLVDAHQSGARDYSAALWSVLMFDAFLRRSGIAESATERAGVAA